MIENADQMSRKHNLNINVLKRHTWLNRTSNRSRINNRYKHFCSINTVSMKEVLMDQSISYNISCIGEKKTNNIILLMDPT